MSCLTSFWMSPVTQETFLWLILCYFNVSLCDLGLYTRITTEPFTFWGLWFFNLHKELLQPSSCVSFIPIFDPISLHHFWWRSFLIVEISTINHCLSLWSTCAVLSSMLGVVAEKEYKELTIWSWYDCEESIIAFILQMSNLRFKEVNKL